MNISITFPTQHHYFFSSSLNHTPWKATSIYLLAFRYFIFCYLVFAVTTVFAHNLHSGVKSVDNSISDHNLTFLHCQHENTANTSYKRKIWLYKEADLENLNEAIKIFNWNYYFENYHDVDIAAKNVGDKLMEFAH